MPLQEVGLEFVTDNDRAFFNAVERADRAVAGFGDSAGRAASGGLNSLSIASIAVGNVIGNVLTAALREGAEAVVGFVGGAITQAADFESSLNRFAAVTGDAMAEAGLEVADFSALFLEMGAKTQFSAGEAADAAVMLAKGGLTPAAIAAGALEAALGLAAAGELDLAIASDILAKQLGVWADTGVTAEEVTNELAQAANASTVDVDELALGLANVGGAARTVGVPFDELTQTMALLAPNFASAADAGTALKTFLLNLQPSTLPARKAMAELNLLTAEGTSKFYDAQGVFIGMEATTQLLQDSFSGLTDAERTMAMEMIFGADAIRVADALARSGAEGYNEMGASMDAAGTAAEQAALKNQGFNFAMESMRGSLETVQIILGTKLLPILTNFVNTALIPAINYVGELSTVFGTEGLAGVMERLGPIFDAAIASLGPAFQAALDVILPIVEQLFNNLIAYVEAQLPSWIATLEHWGMSAWLWLEEAIPPLLAKAGELIGQLLAWVQGQLPGWIAQLMLWGQAAWQWLQEAIPPLLAIAADLAAQLLGWLAAQIPPIASQLAIWGQEFLDWLAEAIPPLMDKAQELASQLLDWIVAQIPGIAALLAEWTIAFIEWVIPIAGDLFILLANLALDLLTWLGETALDIIHTIATEWVPAFLNWITEDLLPKLIPALEDLENRMIGWLIGAAPAIGRAAINIGTAILGGILSALSSLGSEINSMIMGGINGAIANVKASLGIDSPSVVFAQEIGMPIMQGITMGLESAVPAFTSALMGAVSPPRTMAGVITNNYYGGTSNVSFTGNYGSQPGIRDRSDLAWLVARDI